jgi:hypothetical protein
MQSYLMLKHEVHSSTVFFKIYRQSNFLNTEKYIWSIFVYSERFEGKFRNIS